MVPSATCARMRSPAVTCATLETGVPQLALSLGDDGVAAAESLQGTDGVKAAGDGVAAHGRIGLPSRHRGAQTLLRLL